MFKLGTFGNPLQSTSKLLSLKKQIQGACCRMPAAIEDGVVPVPLGLPPTSKVSFLALLFLLFGWNGIVNFHIFVLIDLSHLKQHIGLLHIICRAT